ncbi:hypothetical protein BG000_000502 [Podila horticola]|nr:hypothetical protein BG000_000502 [Podila horticola]
MTPPPLTFLDIPHIVDSIFDHLPFPDLYRCVFVSHAWHNALIPRLWQDVVSFRRIQSTTIQTAYRNCFLTPESRISLSKYAHYIRALTCRGNTLLPLFLKVGLSSLTELAYIIEPTGHQTTSRYRIPDVDLGQLFELIKANPMLHSLSIKITDMDIRIEPHLRRPLDEFVETLSTFPSITNLYLGRLYFFQGEEQERTVLALLEQRLAKVDISRVTRLQFTSLTLAETNTVVPTLRRRWENETGLYSAKWNSLAVAQHAGTLQICMPSVFYSTMTVSMLRRLPGLQGFSTNYLWNFGAEVLQELPVICTQLKDISLNLSGVEGVDLARYLSHPHVHLSTVRLQDIGANVYASGVRPLLLQPTPHFLRNALVVVKTTNGFPMSSVLEILAQCPNLHTLEVYNGLINGFEPDVTPVWASQQLRVLQLGFYLHGGLGNTYITKEHLAVSAASAARIAPSLMAQLGQQRHLRNLHLSFSRFLVDGVAPFLALSSDSANGLQQLNELSRLERFVIYGLTNSMGDSEAAWMAEHWPRLQSIRLPAEASPPGGDQVQQPNYKKWFPDLVIEKSE